MHAKEIPSLIAAAAKFHHKLQFAGLSLWYLFWKGVEWMGGRGGDRIPFGGMANKDLGKHEK